MKKQIKQAFLYGEQSNIKQAFPIVVIILLLAGVLGALLFNTVRLNGTLRKNTVDYANDVSAQLASNISYRMQTRESYIRNLADTFSGMPKFLLTEELLERKAQYLEMEKIFVVNGDGSTIPADQNLAGLEQYLKEHPDLYTDAQIFCSDGSEVCFSAPIIRETGENSLLIGIRSNDMLQQMLQNVDFKNQGLCCVVDSDGTIVVSATDETPFLELSDIFNDNTGEQDVRETQKMLEDIRNHRSGLARLSDVGGEEILLGYDFLEINDWMLLTLVTADLFSESTAPYLVCYIAIIIFLFVLMLMILLFVAWYYRRTLRQLQRIALTDLMTGGQNDLAFRIGCENQLREFPEKEYAIIYLNIRNFKQFNERFGIKQGDELLRQIYRLLQSRLREGELMCRSAGDHFYLLLECFGEENMRRRLNEMIQWLKEELSGKFSFEQIGFDQGAYLIREQDTDFMLLSDRAKVASTCQTGKDDCRFYDDELRRQLEKEHMRDASFQSALKNHEFQLYIQPKVCPGTNTADAGEVLVRWLHPKFGLLFPGEFIPFFERNGKICELDLYIFEETCRLMKGWIQKGCAMPLSVNLSRAHLISNDVSFLNQFCQIKEKYGIPDGQIELELTESLMLERRDIHLVTTMINRIREMGFLCSIDDFGFGYSSLTMLKDMNVTTVKLDRQFFLDESEKSWMVVNHLIQLTHNLGMTVVAEGIENQEQVERLRAYGCDLIQGYVYAKPMKAADFEQWSVL